MKRNWFVKAWGSPKEIRGDWGTEILKEVGSTDKIEYFIHDSRVLDDIYESLHEIIYIKVHSGVIYTDRAVTYLGINLGGYGYKLKDCKQKLIKMAPFNTAVFNISTKTNKNLEFHLLLGYEIIAIKDKISGEMVDLPSPIYKEFLVYFTSEGILIC